MNWTASRIQFGRLREHGMADAEIKEIVPICQKCATVVIQERKGK